MQDKILSIVIPCYNKFAFTRSCLADLARLPNDHQVIVIDNGSSDETQTQLQGSTEITYIRNNDNKGFASASNQGYSLAAAPNVLFLNNDIRVKSPYYESWTQPLLQHCSTSLVGPTMGQLDDNLNFIQEANKLLPGKSYMSGWCLASSKEIWERLRIKDYVGPFSEEFFCYFEDTDMGFRSRKLGIPFQVVDIPVVHFGKQTSSQLNVHKLYTQARQIFVKKWGK